MANTRAQKTAQNLSTLTTAGDIAYASAAGTPARLGIGSTSQVLTVSGGVPAWATPAGGGKVLQAVSATYGSVVTSTSTSWATTGLTASITPSATSSKILVIFLVDGTFNGTSDGSGAVKVRLVRGATALLTSADLGFTRSTLEMMLSYAGTYLDSPNTTSSTTYTMEFRSTVATKTVRVQENASTSSIVLLEIGA